MAFNAKLSFVALTCVTIVTLAASAQGPAKKVANTANSAHPVAATSAPPRKMEFLRDVAPILDRSGCSTADCHGKFGGRGGLQISLLTLSPEDDFEPIVFGARGRRINFSYPEKSLLLQKATFTVPHAGGQRIKVGSPEYNIFLNWIKQGANFDDNDPKVVSVVITPQKSTLAKVGSKVQLHAWATYTDGSRKDVTTQTVFQSTNDAVLKVSRDGLTLGQRWGGGAVLGRYLGNVVAAFITLPQERKGAYPVYKPANVVDNLVFDNLKSLNVLQSAVSTDEEYLRRVTLDTLGRLPTAAEHDKFCTEPAVDKRATLVDSLIDNPEYTDFQTLRLCDLLRCSPRKFGQGNGTLGDRSAAILYEWIWKSVASNKPWDQFVRDLITAKGSTYQVAPANFHRVENTPNDRMENLGQAFLGVRMSCARCHKHPFDRWTTDDYWNFAAVLGKVNQRGGKLEGEAVIEYGQYNQITNQSVNGRNKGKVAPPTYLGDKSKADDKGNMVDHLADWVVAPDNHFFARATVNRIWSYFFSRGIIHPVDDMRATSPESVPGLLDALAKELVDSKYDIKHVMRLILNSKTYQLSSVPNKSNSQDDRFFSHFLPKAMPAPALLDMINMATGAKEQFGNFPERSRAIQAAVPTNSSFMTAFGQSHREFLADIDPKLEPNLVQTLLMINSPYVDDKIKNGSTIPDILKASKTDEELINNMFLVTLGRKPTDSDVNKAMALMKNAKSRAESAQDMLWALVTSREFYFNH